MSYKVICPVIVIFSMALYIYQLLEYKITRVEIFSDTKQNNTTLINYNYQVDKTEFGQSRAKEYIEITVMLFRDAFNLFIMLLVNIMIIVLTKMSMDEKKNLLNYTNRLRANYFERYLEYCNNTAMIRRLANKENKQIAMMILTCFNSIIGRLPILFFFVKKNITSINDSNSKFGALMVYISYSVYFFLYYQSNYKFRRLFKLYLSRMLGSNKPGSFEKKQNV